MVEGHREPVANDPFWSVVRREHPDIDLVLFDGPSPLDAPDLDPGKGLDLGQARLLVRGVDDVYGSLLDLLPADLPEPTRSWRTSSRGHAYVVEKALRESGGENGLELLRAIGSHLHDRGWAVRAAGDARRPHLLATNGWADLDAVSGRAAARLTIAGPMVLLSRDHLRTLRADGVRS